MIRLDENINDRLNYLENTSFEILALAPLAILPEYQKSGIGKMLMNKAIERAKELGYKSIVVLWHENYYPKFGFEKASKYGVKAPFEVPDEAYMMLELLPDGLNGVSGVVEYSKAFLSRCWVRRFTKWTIKDIIYSSIFKMKIRF